MLDTAKATGRSVTHAAPTHQARPSGRPLSMPAIEGQEPPKLSAIVVVGGRRDRARRVLDALAALPICLQLRLGAGVAEALGYGRGPGGSEMRFSQLEME